MLITVAYCASLMADDLWAWGLGPLWPGDPLAVVCGGGVALPWGHVLVRSICRRRWGCHVRNDLWDTMLQICINSGIAILTCFVFAIIIGLVMWFVSLRMSAGVPEHVSIHMCTHACLYAGCSSASWRSSVRLRKSSRRVYHA